jgi:hypothetical protein
LGAGIFRDDVLLFNDEGDELLVPAAFGEVRGNGVAFLIGQWSTFFLESSGDFRVKNLPAGDHLFSGFDVQKCEGLFNAQRRQDVCWS